MTGEISFPKKIPDQNFVSLLFDSGRLKFTTISHEKNRTPSPLAGSLDPWESLSRYQILVTKNPTRKKKKQKRHPQKPRLHFSGDGIRGLRGVVHLILKHLISFLQAFHDTLVRVHLLRFCENFNLGSSVINKLFFCSVIIWI